MIRAATEQDLERLIALDRALFGPDAWGRDAWAGELAAPSRVHLVATDDGGTVTAYASSMVAGDTADLLRIGVDREVRRTGLGSSLLADVVRHARDRGAARLLLEVSAANEGAVAFYTAHGFATVHRRVRYYRDGSDALVMEQPIGSGP